MIQIFGNSISMAEKALDFQWSKQQVLAANLANVDTPGYKTKYVTFEETFRSKLKNAAVTGNRQLIGSIIENARWEVNNTNNETSRLDGNNVDADVEMVEVTRSALQYQYLLYSINSDHHRLQSVIKGQ